VKSANRMDPTARANSLGAVLEKEADSDVTRTQPVSGVVGGMMATPVSPVVLIADALGTAAKLASPAEAEKVLGLPTCSQTG
jgi:hypothetical protein